MKKGDKSDRILESHTNDLTRGGDLISRLEEKTELTDSQAKGTEKSISSIEQLRFFVPLAMTQVLIATTHSLFNAALARFPSPEVLISAFSVTKSILQMIQNPVSMIKHTMVSLTTDKKSYQMISRFVTLMGFIIVGLFSIFAFSNMSRWMMSRLIGVEGQVLEEAIIMLRVLILFPLFVSVRDFYQGVAIKLRMTPIVTIASVMRVIFVGIMVLVAENMSFLPGSYFAPGIFAAALFVEALTVVIIVRRQTPDIPRAIEKQTQFLEGDFSHKKEISYGTIFVFFVPLVVTALLRTTSNPIINAGLARTPQPEIAISAYAVGWSVGFLALAPLMMFHQVPLNFLQEKDTEANYRSVKRFALLVGLTLSIGVSLIGFTPIGYFVLHNLMGTDEVISTMAADVLKVMALLPMFFVTRQYMWGLFLKRQSTKIVSIGKMINLGVLILTVLTGAKMQPVNPAIIGAVAMVMGEMVECTYLFIAIRKVDRKEKEVAKA